MEQAFETSPAYRLFDASISEQILLAVHHLGKPTATQLARLFAHSVAGERSMRRELKHLTTGENPYLTSIKPLDIDFPSRFLPTVFLDTTKSRRAICAMFGVPFRRPPETPSRDWRFLRHDVTLADELISIELCAQDLGCFFRYEPHFLGGGERLYPKVSITHNGLTHALNPLPDKTIVLGNYHVILEHDCGEETVECGNIIRDATIGRKQLVYDQLLHNAQLRQLGWDKTLVLYIIDTKRGSVASARKRIKRCLETMPETVDAQRFWFVDRLSFMAAGYDLHRLEMLRGDGRLGPLPCFSTRH